MTDTMLRSAPASIAVIVELPPRPAASTSPDIKAAWLASDEPRLVRSTSRPWRANAPLSTATYSGAWAAATFAKPTRSDWSAAGLAVAGAAVAGILAAAGAAGARVVLAGLGGAAGAAQAASVPTARVQAA